MPEPDFDQIARRLHETVGCDHGTDAETVAAQVTLVVEQLRQVWNARGAADLVKVDEALSWMLDTLTAADPSVRQLREAIAALDRKG